jgi:hypothetical protein
MGRRRGSRQVSVFLEEIAARPVQLLAKSIFLLRYHNRNCGLSDPPSITRRNETALPNAPLGAPFPGAAAAALHSALSRACDTITRMPAHFMT